MAENVAEPTESPMEAIDSEVAEMEVDGMAEVAGVEVDEEAAVVAEA